MGKDFTVTVYSEREEEFRQIFGTATVPVLLLFPYNATLDGRPEPEAVYMLDADRLTAEQHDRLVTHLARKFASSEVEIRRYLHNEGLPIRAVDTVATIEHPQKWMADDMPGGDPDNTDEFQPLSTDDLQYPTFDQD